MEKQPESATSSTIRARLPLMRHQAQTLHRPLHSISLKYDFYKANRLALAFHLFMACSMKFIRSKECFIV